MVFTCETDENELRADTNFRERLQPEHHLDESPLTKLHDFGLISNMPLDYMHMICLGLMRRLILLWIRSSSGSAVAPKFRRLIYNRTAKLTNTIPLEFHRKPRSLSEIDNWKATEFRFFLLYSGPFVLRHYLPQKYYNNFLLLHIVMRLLAIGNYTDRTIATCKTFITQFLREYESIYGSNEMVYNVHSSKHIVSEPENTNQFMVVMKWFIMYIQANT
ncbi:hypothetical protein QE152_g9414 [Popillia japonica]|uniref:Uncharacterized protein n=1 Tax=Popillia japonica TaxID=7064 RepID=A0AAW1LUY3_POPJA